MYLPYEQYQRNPNWILPSAKTTVKSKSNIVQKMPLLMLNLQNA